MNQTDQVEESKEILKQEAKGFFESIKEFIKQLLDFREDTDQEQTIQAIQNDISIKGATTWILICSIFVASIGLNSNSTAVVIGAMLISPLMGPILGVGMSIAINDIDTLKKSIANLITMIIVSLITAFVFFYFFPLSEDTSELLGRTKPDIRDVLIAFFGGLALIIARTKKGTIASVIFGVAIATALMPPLCTVGYGLAKWVGGDPIGLEYARGAMYLFTINTLFIALATFIVLKLLGFTMMRYVNSARRKFIARVASILAIIAVIPAVYTFIEVYQNSIITKHYNEYIKKEIESNHDLWLQRKQIDIDNKKINLFFNGDVAESTETYLRNEIKEYKGLQNFELIINANRKKTMQRVMDAYDRAIADLDKKDNIIDGLQKEIGDLKTEISSLQTRIEEDELKRNKKSIPYVHIMKDAKIRYHDIKEINFAKVLHSHDFLRIDTISSVSVKWNKKLKKQVILKQEEELRKWLQKEMNLDTLIISNY